MCIYMYVYTYIVYSMCMYHISGDQEVSNIIFIICYVNIVLLFERFSETTSGQEPGQLYILGHAGALPANITLDIYCDETCMKNASL